MLYCRVIPNLAKEGEATEKDPNKLKVLGQYSNAVILWSKNPYIDEELKLCLGHRPVPMFESIEGQFLTTIIIMIIMILMMVIIILITIIIILIIVIIIVIIISIIIILRDY